MDSNRPVPGETIKRAAINDADREFRWNCIRLGRDFRDLRLRAQVSQAAIARAIGVSRSVICRLEAGDEAVAAYIRARAAVIIGAEFRMSIYNAGEALIRDRAQARMVEQVLASCHPRWRATVESPVPGLGRRSTDLRLDHDRDIVLLEAESRVGGLEDILRELHDKRAAVVEASDRASRVHVVLVLRETRHHQSLVRSHPGTIAAAFPVSSDRLWGALRSAAEPWPGDGILWVKA